jgi:hypothetical protein
MWFSEMRLGGRTPTHGIYVGLNFVHFVSLTSRIVGVSFRSPALLNVIKERTGWAKSRYTDTEEIEQC